MQQAEEREPANGFIATTRYYGRSEVDKSVAEDRQLSRPGEVLGGGRTVGLDLLPNPTRHIAIPAEENCTGRTGFFRSFFDKHLQYWMNWPVPNAGSRTPPWRFPGSPASRQASRKLAIPKSRGTGNIPQFVE